MLSSQPEALDLIECQALLGAVIELGGAWTLMRGQGLGVLERLAILQIRRNPGGTEAMATDGALMPAAFARRRIMRQVSAWLIRCWASAEAFQPLAVRNSQPLRSSPMPAARYRACSCSASAWWQGMTCCTAFFRAAAAPSRRRAVAHPRL
jgi:hypothetical protein